MSGGDKAAAFRQRLEGWIAPLSFEDKTVVLDWVEKALAGNPDDDGDYDAGLLAGCIEEKIEIAGVREGEVTFRLTTQGFDEVGRWLIDSAEARHYLKSLGGGAAVDEPKEPQ